MHKQVSVFLFCLIFSLVSCKNSRKQTEGELGLANDSLKFIKIENAGEIQSVWSKENTLIYQWIAEPDILHPTNGVSSQRTEVLMYTQMFLLFGDFRSGEIVPMLASKMPTVSEDGLRISFELRSEPRWNNGEALSSDDIVFTAKASKCPFTDNPNAKSFWDNLKTIETDASDPLKFIVVMKSPYMHNVAFWGDWPIMQRKFHDPGNILTKYSLEQFDDTSSSLENDGVLRKWANEFNDVKFGRDPKFLNGLGPYKVSSWDAGQTLTLEKKTNYWTQNSQSIYETAYPEKIIFKVNRDANSQMLEFKSQTVDASTTLSARSLLELQSDSVFNSNYHSRFVDTYFYTYIGMNNRPDGLKRKKIFDDVLVRKAVANCIPYNEINSIINKGLNKRTAGPVSALKKESNRSLKLIETNSEESRRLLSQAGWADTDNDNILDRSIEGKKTTMEFDIAYLTTQVEWKDMATMIADALSKIGMKANLQPLDYPVFVGNNRQHDFDMMIAVWGASSAPDDFTQLWHTKSWENYGSNYIGFGNKESDALIDSIKVTMNDSLRIEMSGRFQQIIYDEQPMVFLFSSLRRNVIHQRFGNVELYFERPGMMLSNFKLLATEGISP